MRRPSLRTAVPLGVVAVMLAGIALLGLTETDAERAVKRALGYSTGGCQPTVNAASPWQFGPSLGRPRDELRASVVDGAAYLVGGVTGIEQLDSGSIELGEIAAFTRFDARTGSYRAMPPLPEPANHAGVVAHDGSIYVAGGYQPRLDAPAKRRFSRYILEEDRWESLPPLPVPRGAMAVGVIDDRLILAGGESAGREVRRVDAYDLRSGRWARLADLPNGREHVAGTVVEGQLYVLGGRAGASDALALAARYDPDTDTWERLPPLPVPAGGADAVAAGGAVIVVGGGNDRGGTVTGAVQRFDVQRGRWELLPELRTPRHGHAAARIGDRLWVFGGSPCAYFAATDLVESFSLPEATAHPLRGREAR